MSRVIALCHKGKHPLARTVDDDPTRFAVKLAVADTRERPGWQFRAHDRLIAADLADATSLYCSDCATVYFLAPGALRDAVANGKPILLQKEGTPRHAR